MRPRRGHPVAKGLAAATAALGLGAVAVVGVVHALDARPGIVVPRCSANVDGTTWSFAPDQADNAALIAATTVRRGLPAHAATVGLATAIQESKLRNLDYGDADSLGLFQQRPSQGWGTQAQVSDPVYATGMFYDHLVKVAGWQEMEVTEAAQAVQRSAFPRAYARHERKARAWASSLTGYSPSALTCTLGDPAGTASAQRLESRIGRDLGELPVHNLAPGVLVVDASVLDTSQPERMAWAVGQWAVAVADGQDIVDVQVGDQLWTRAGVWTTAEDAPAEGTVRITIASQ
ncbi:MAG: hypothetical protein FWE61_03390 [Micrococcales bacterium]|nr:hypothetical protein [Micrococcales bacterium]